MQGHMKVYQLEPEIWKACYIENDKGVVLEEVDFTGRRATARLLRSMRDHGIRLHKGVMFRSEKVTT